MKEYVYHPSLEECKAIFASSCIESAARATHSSPSEMYERMARVGLIENYIMPCYDVLHTESRANVTNDILYTLQLWESKNQQS